MDEPLFELPPQAYEAAAALTALPLTGPEAREVADLLNAWIPAALSLSSRMQAVTDMAPIPTFSTLSGIHGEEAGGA